MGLTMPHDLGIKVRQIPKQNSNLVSKRKKKKKKIFYGHKTKSPNISLGLIFFISRIKG